MEKAIKYWYAMSDPAILEILGKFIQQTRLQQNKTQQKVAVAAGVNRSTIVQIENGGGGTLISFIQILRALEQLQLFQSFEIRQQLSPLQLAKIDQKKRQRASNKKATGIEKPKSDW
ncbi:MAG: helix-turn-helix domain-containing protein [Chitinophagaceae bacterium]